MIIATAGHVDHGKTLLVRALTGIDTDRLPEEKKRGLTIDLGFAYMPIAGHETVGFIDVPGHERFIRNALCGLAGTDFVLFIVAVDDGPMPQTVEHLAIVDLLGISNGVIALTKIDRVGRERIASVKDEIAALFGATTLANARVFPVSAVSGDGISSLREHLVEAGAATPPRSAGGNFRLAVDRAFDVVGAGFVVTGTVFSGSVAVGDTVVVPGSGTELRVRGIHAQNSKSQAGRAGQRCALNLTGPALRKDQIARGVWIGSARVPAPVAKLDAYVGALDSLAEPLAHWTPVHVHIGAAEVNGRIAVLEGDRIEPGEKALAQLVLDRPIGATCGDNVIIRDQSARATLGGGRVVDIFPPARGRARPQRLQWLRGMMHTDHSAALEALLSVSSSGVELEQFACSRNLTAQEMADIEAGLTLQTIAAPGLRLGFSADRWHAVREAALGRLAAWHATSPGAIGLGENKILAGSGIRLEAKAQAAVAAELVREGAIVKGDMGLRLPTHEARLEPADAKMWQAVEPVLASAALRPMSVFEIANAAGLNARRLESLLVRAGRLGLVHRISKTRISTPDALVALAVIAERLAAESGDGLIGVAEFRDASGIGRNMSVEIVEYFDKLRFTQRVGDRRKLLHPAAKLLGTA